MCQRVKKNVGYVQQKLTILSSWNVAIPYVSCFSIQINGYDMDSNPLQCAECSKKVSMLELFQDNIKEFKAKFDCALNKYLISFNLMDALPNVPMFVSNVERYCV